MNAKLSAVSAQVKSPDLPGVGLHSYELERPAFVLPKENAITEIAERLLDAGPLAGALRSTPRVAMASTVCSARLQDSADNRCVEVALGRMTGRLGAPPLMWRPNDAKEFTSFENAISHQLAITPEVFDLLKAPGESGHVIDSATDKARAKSFQSSFPPHPIHTSDDMLIRSYSAGRRGAPAVVIASACGMPAELCRRWMEHLSKEFFVTTWETRGLFGSPLAVVGDSASYGLQAQSRDIIEVMDHYNIQHAHVMGVCGGAVLAIAAAVGRPDRITSLSLWHGDFNCGPDCSKTTHQHRMLELMSFVGESRTNAASIHKLMAQRAGPADQRRKVDHLTLYPYANEDLLHTYGLLNGTIMSADVEAMASQVGQPTLVVTSRDDTTAHPDGSRRVASLLASSELHLTKSGDHLSVFSAVEHLVTLVADFARRHAPETGKTAPASGR